MKKDLIFIALLIVAAILMCVSCYFGAVYLCESVGRELTDNNIQLVAVVEFAFEFLLTTVGVSVWAMFYGE